MECESLVEDARDCHNCTQVESDELCAFLRQQKHLRKLTDRALRKDQPLIISNLMHESIALQFAEDLTDTQKDEEACLLALSIRAFPGCPSMEITVSDDVQEEYLEVCRSSIKLNTSPVATTMTLLDSNLPQIVSRRLCFAFCTTSNFTIISYF